MAQWLLVWKVNHELKDRNKVSIYQIVTKDEVILLLNYLNDFDNLKIRITNYQSSLFKIYGYDNHLEIRGFN